MNTSDSCGPDAEAHDATPDRAWLGFAPAVEDAFSFLLADGFHIVESAPTIVRYQKGATCVTLFHGRRSWEIGLEVGPEDGERFSIGGILEAAGAEEAASYRAPAIGTAAGVDKWVHTIADLFRRYGQPALELDPVFLERMRQQSRDWWAAFNLDGLATRNRPRAEAAFREGRYREAAELYEEMVEALTPVEKKKLALARRRSDNTDKK
jgi:hypothetical protein